MDSGEAVIVFARQPRAGVSKTRLSPPLTLEEAAGLYACFLKDTLALVDRFAAGATAGPARILAYSPPAAGAVFATLAPHYRRIPQTGTGLGVRMRQALEAVLTGETRRAVLIGSDLPHMPLARLGQALQSLRDGADLVLGPALDGGYYLIGLSQPHAGLFDLPMGNPQVLERTLQAAARLGLRVFQLPTEFDIDTGTDLERLQRLLDDDPSIPAVHTRNWMDEKATTHRTNLHE